jgi:Fibrillarin
MGMPFVSLDTFTACSQTGLSMHAGRDLVNMAKQRPNIIPIIEDARHPNKYRMLVPMVDVVFADVAQPDQASSTVRASGLLCSDPALAVVHLCMCRLGFLQHTVRPDVHPVICFFVVAGKGWVLCA